MQSIRIDWTPTRDQQKWGIVVATAEQYGVAVSQEKHHEQLKEAEGEAWRVKETV